MNDLPLCICIFISLFSRLNEVIFYLYVLFTVHDALPTLKQVHNYHKLIVYIKLLYTYVQYCTLGLHFYLSVKHLISRIYRIDILNVVIYWIFCIQLQHIRKHTVQVNNKQYISVLHTADYYINGKNINNQKIEKRLVSEWQLCEQWLH